MNSFRFIGFTFGTFILTPQMASAHVELSDAHNTLHGFVHPLTGIDHILAMVIVGLLAANLGGRALLSVPLSFIAMMMLGAFFGVSSFSFPFNETGIAVSVLVLGTLLAVGSRPPVALAMALVGTFAIFHGYAHGVEMPVDASGLFFSLGFVVATALLHCVGMGLGLFIQQILPELAELLVKIGGSAVAVTGLALMAGLF